MYNFTLFAVFANVRSSGTHHAAATGETFVFYEPSTLGIRGNVFQNNVCLLDVAAPRDVVLFKNLNQTESSITLEWEKVDNITGYTLKLGKDEEKVPASNSTFTWSSLHPGTLYNFTLFTLFENISSSGKNFSAATGQMISLCSFVTN